MTEITMGRIAGSALRSKSRRRSTVVSPAVQRNPRVQPGTEPGTASLQGSESQSVQ